MIESNIHRVRRLRLPGRIPTPRFTRRRIEVAFANAVDSPRLGKEAILCVRRLALPFSRIERLSDLLEKEALAAARPARGFVPANANAVVFANRAELLASLARDWCCGAASNQWWWPALFPRDDFATVVRRAWLEDVRSVPAALARLDSAGFSAPFLAKFSCVDVAALWRKIENAFHLAALAAVWSEIDISRFDPNVVAQSCDSPPWAPWVELQTPVTPEAARVLVVAVLLERAPAVVRSVSFTRKIREWMRMARIVDVAVPTQTKKNATTGQNFPEATDDSVLRLPSLSRRPESSHAISRQTAPPTSLYGTPPVTDTRQDLLSPDDRRATDVSTNSQSQIRHPTKRGDHMVDRAVLHPAANDIDLTLPNSHEYDRIQTEWGGVFYLVNVAIALGVYGDFTTPARPGLALPLWDYLSLIGREMIGDIFAADPLSTLFARLSGRNKDELPGAYFEPEEGESFVDWVERNCHQIDKRLTAALAVTDPEALHTMVLNDIAQVETGALRVDVHFNLATHPIELRIAGLDRDPGWVPAGGRSIYFHYD